MEYNIKNKGIKGRIARGIATLALAASLPLWNYSSRNETYTSFVKQNSLEAPISVKNLEQITECGISVEINSEKKDNIRTYTQQEIEKVPRIDPKIDVIGKISDSKFAKNKMGTWLRNAYEEYDSKISKIKLTDASYSKEIKFILNKVEEKREIIESAARKADIPPELLTALLYREANMDTGCYLHNGAKLGEITYMDGKKVQFFDEKEFTKAAVDAVNRKRLEKEVLGLSYVSHDVSAMATMAERWQGFGNRAKGRSSSYVLGGTNFAPNGMYVKDGVYDKDKADPRPGVLPIILSLKNNNTFDYEKRRTRIAKNN